MNKHNLNWQTWLKNGDQYLKAATPKGMKSRFGANIRYNLLSMSLMAAFAPEDRAALARPFWESET